MTAPSTDAQRLLRIAERELSDEKLLWAGQPNPRASLIRAAPIWLFAFPLTVFCLIAAIVAVDGMVPSGFKGRAPWQGWLTLALMGLPFLATGIWMLGVPVWKAHRAYRTLHVLTSRRLMTIVDGRKTEIQSFDPARIVALRRRNRGAGDGDLEIGFGSYRNAEGENVELKELWIGIPEVAKLERLLISGPANRD